MGFHFFQFFGYLRYSGSCDYPVFLDNRKTVYIDNKNEKFLSQFLESFYSVFCD